MGLRYSIRKGVFKRKNLSATLATVFLISAIIIIKYFGFVFTLVLAIQLLIAVGLIGIIIYYAHSKGWNMKLIIVLIGVILFISFFENSEKNVSKSPVGNSYFGVGNYSTEEYSFGNSYGQGDDYLSYSKFIYNSNGIIEKTVHKKGTFNYENNIIICNYNDEWPSNKLQFKEVDSEWSVIDENGVVFILDNPSKQK